MSTPYIPRDYHDNVALWTLAAMSIIDTRINIDAMPPGPLKNALLDAWQDWRDRFTEVEPNA